MQKIINFLGQSINRHCRCFESTCRVTEITNTVQKFLRDAIPINSPSTINQNKCNIIYDSPISDEKAEETEQEILDSLNFFVELNLLQYYNGQYILWTNETISWKYIQNIKYEQLPDSFKIMCNQMNSTVEDCVDLFKLLFWFLRKVIVDDIIISEFYRYDNCLALSAGSIKITSDMDVTVYGSCSQVLANDFEKKIIQLFGNTSDIIFDTNVYSSSFIDMIEPENLEWYTRFTCKRNTMWVLRSIGYVANDQHIWSGLKLVQNMKKMDRNEFNEQTKKIIKSSIYQELDDIIYKLKQITESAHEFTFSTKFSETRAKNIEDYANDLSTANFKSKETYFTRGAFIDVVLNQQICKDSENIEMTKDDYLDSCIENLADYCLHDKKQKYLDRAKNAADKMKIDLSLNYLDVNDINDILVLSWMILVPYIKKENILNVLNRASKRITVRKISSVSMANLFEG